MTEQHSHPHEQAWRTEVRQIAMKGAERLITRMGEVSKEFRALKQAEKREYARQLANELVDVLQLAGVYLTSGGRAHLKGQFASISMDGKKVKLSLTMDPKHSPEEAALLVGKAVLVVHQDVTLFDGAREELWNSVKSLQLDLLEEQGKTPVGLENVLSFPGRNGSSETTAAESGTAGASPETPQPESGTNPAGSGNEQERATGEGMPEGEPPDPPAPTPIGGKGKGKGKDQPSA